MSVLPSFLLSAFMPVLKNDKSAITADNSFVSRSLAVSQNFAQPIIFPLRAGIGKNNQGNISQEHHSSHCYQLQVLSLTMCSFASFYQVTQHYHPNHSCRLEKDVFVIVSDSYQLL